MGLFSQISIKYSQIYVVFGSGAFYNTAMERIYLCIDLKSFYASVECVERGLNPFEVNLVVADPTRHGAITLAATPAIKKLGVPSRGRIYEIDENIDDNIFISKEEV